MKIAAILPHVNKYGGVRRYLEFGNNIIKLGHQYDLYVIDFSVKYEWLNELNFTGNFLNFSKINSDYDAAICGDAQSLSYLEKFDSKLKIVNIIFPPNTGYLLGQYEFGHNDYLYVGNGTGWTNFIGILRPNYFTIPGAINLNMFKPKKVKKDHDKFNILFAAKNRPWKGNNVILEAVKRLKNENIGWGCFDTEEHPDFDKEIKQYINLPQKQMSDIYCSYNCFVSCEKLAGWQNCSAEAMACGIPVITTEIGARDFANKDTAIIIPTDSVDKLIESILLLKNNKGVRDAISHKGKEFIKQFSWENYAKEWEKFILTNIEKKQKVYTMNDINLDLVKKEEIENKSKQAKDILPPKKEEPKISISDAVKNKAKGIRNIKVTGVTTIKQFDKYEDRGAYHWTGNDKIYEKYVSHLETIFSNFKKIYPNLEILDVGGGDGFISFKLAKLRYKVKLIDNNPVAIRLAADMIGKNKEERSPIEIQQQDFFELDKMEDCVLLSQVIEHFSDPKTVTDKILKFLPKLIVLATPLKRPDGSLWDPSYHYTEYTESELLNVLSDFKDDYKISLGVYKPYHIFVILEKKSEIIKRYISNLNLSEINQDKFIKDIVELSNNKVLDIIL